MTGHKHLWIRNIHWKIVHCVELIRFFWFAGSQIDRSEQENRFMETENGKIDESVHGMICNIFELQQRRCSKSRLEFHQCFVLFFRHFDQHCKCWPWKGVHSHAVKIAERVQWHFKCDNVFTRGAQSDTEYRHGISSSSEHVFTVAGACSYILDVRRVRKCHWTNNQASFGST